MARTDGRSWDGNWRENCSASGEYLEQTAMVSAFPMLTATIWVSIMTTE